MRLSSVGNTRGGRGQSAHSEVSKDKHITINHITISTHILIIIINKQKTTSTTKTSSSHAHHNQPHHIIINKQNNHINNQNIIACTSQSTTSHHHRMNTSQSTTSQSTRTSSSSSSTSKNNHINNQNIIIASAVTQLPLLLISAPLVFSSGHLAEPPDRFPVAWPQVTVARLAPHMHNVVYSRQSFSSPTEAQNSSTCGYPKLRYSYAGYPLPPCNAALPPCNAATQ